MTTLNQIRKRSGDVVSFDVTKIIEAAFAALKASGTPNREVAEHLSVDVVQELLDKGYDQKEQIPTVELVQDLLENAFVKRGLTHAAKAFIIYREEHKKAREGKPVMIDAKELVDGYINQEDWRVNENSNSGYSYASLLNHASGAVIANYTLANVYPTEIAQAHVEGDIHLHDLSCGIVGYCAGWSLRELLEMGFKGRNGRSSANPAKHFDTALLQAVNFLCTLQTEWAGAQAFSSFDTFMAPFIRHDKLDYTRVKQCMQQFIFGLNIASRWGQCVTMDVKCLKADGTVAGYDELKIGDEIITFDVVTGKLKTDTITHLTKKHHVGIAHKYYWYGNGFRNIAFTVTPEHRMVHCVKDKYYIAESKELFNTHEYIAIPEVSLSPAALNHVKKDDFPEYIALDKYNSPYRASEVEIDEDVWCPTTDTGTFVAWINGALLILGNCPFTNLTFDWVVPEDLKAHPVIIGGKLMDTETYGDFQEEMDMINKAFLEVMAEGDSDGRIFTFPIPTYNLTKDFNYDSENAKLLFEVTGKYGLPYFQNFINSDLKPSDVRSFCCRLQLNMKELRNKTGGLFGAGEKTGCYDEATEILTKNRGWIPFKELTLEDTVFTRNPEGVLEYHKPIRLFEYDYDDDMIHLNNTRVDLLVTPNHRMVYVDKHTGEQGFVCADDYSFTKHPIPAFIQNLLPDRGTFTLPEITNTWIAGNHSSLTEKVWTPLEIDSRLWLQFLGWYISEGSFDNETIAPSHGYRVVISQIKPHMRKKLKELLEKLPFNFTETEDGYVICNKQLWSYLKPLGDCYARYIPKDILYNYSAEELECLLETLIYGDGSVNSATGQTTYYTVSKQLSDDIQTLCILCGKTTNIRVREARDCIIKGRSYSKEQCNTAYELIISSVRCKYVKPERISKEHYKGKVYCCEVPNNTLMVRRNGRCIWCGNSVGVVTINLPRIGYLSNTEEEYFERLDKLIDLAKQALEIKREVVQHNLDNDLMPYTKVYLGHLKQHFSTVGIIGMNESCLNFLGCSVCDPEGQEFAIKVLLHLRERIQAIQEETGHVYNLEGVPGEGTSFRLAKIDKKKFPEIICAGDKNPYYTNSTQLPVGYTTDLFEALDLQEPLQKEYTGGTVFHAFIGERIDDPNLVAELVKRIATNYKIPYFTLTPSFSICPVHGYIPGEHTNCPYAKN